MEFRAGIERIIGSAPWRREILIPGNQIPPGVIVLLRRDLAREHAPTPFVDDDGEGEDR